MLKKPIWNTIETTLFYYSGNSTSPQVWFQGYNTDFLITSVSKIDSLNTIYSDAVSKYAKWALDHLEFGVSISSIPTTTLLLAHPDLKTNGISGLI